MNQTKDLRQTLTDIRQSRSFEAVFIVLVTISMAALVGEFLLDVEESTATRLGRINVAIAWAFLFDFCLGLFISTDKKRYWKTDWWLLLASIPLDEYVFGSLRIVRLFRIFRVWGITTRPATIKHMRQQKARHSHRKNS